MLTAVQHRIDAPVHGAQDNYRRIADEGRLVIARVRNLDVEAQKFQVGP
jgi:hypothetical protein